MELTEYLKSKDFLLFQDEALRNEACKAVQHYLKKAQRPAEKAQLYSIPSVIRAGGRATLEKLAKNQAEKNTKLENKAFWQFLLDLLFNLEPPDFALRHFLRQHLSNLGFLESETAQGLTKPEQRQIRKANRAKVDLVMDSLLAVYFEHFNCHYFYRLQ